MQPATVREFIGEYLANSDTLEPYTDPLTGSEPFEAVGIDSIGIVDLVSKVERRFGITIPDSHLPTLITVDDMAGLVVDLSNRSAAASS